MIYLMQAGVTERVKIGRSKDPQLRRQTIGSWEPHELKIIRLLDVDDWVEKWFHDLFADYRLHGEWFTLQPEMLTVLPPTQQPLRPSMAPVSFIFCMPPCVYRQLKTFCAMDGMTLQDAIEHAICHILDEDPMWEGGGPIIWDGGEPVD